MATTDQQPQLLKGVLPMLLLALLREEESYGYELVVRLHDVGLREVAAGTVYPVLTRLEREGSLTSRLVASDAGPARKYYRLTAAGAHALAATGTAWTTLRAVVDRVLPPEGEPS